MIGNRIDLLFCNEHEARSWAGCDDLETALTALKQVARQFAVTCGAKGALLFDGTDTHTVASFPVKAVDTNGAGDMFAGAFLYGITRGLDFATAGRLASLSAATVVSDYGPRLTRTQQRAILQQLQLD